MNYTYLHWTRDPDSKVPTWETMRVESPEALDKQIRDLQEHGITKFQVTDDPERR